MLTTTEILQETDRRGGFEPQKRYGRRQLERLEDANLLRRIPSGMPLKSIIEQETINMRDDKKEVAQTLIFPSDWRIPAGDTNSVIKDITENGYHPLHRKAFIRKAVEEQLKRKRVAKKDRDWLSKWASGALKTPTLEVITAAQLLPGDVSPFSLSDPTSLPTSGTGIPRTRERAREPSVKLGRCYWTLGAPHQFVTMPYINILDGARIFARAEMKELPKELRGSVQVKLKEVEGGYALRGRVVTPLGLTYKRPILRRTSIQLLPLARNRKQAAKNLWTINAHCTCPDYKYRGEEARMAAPVIKMCKHLVATILKGMTLFPGDFYKQAPLEWYGSPIPIPLGSSRGYVLHRQHELETRALIENENGGVQPLNKHELSWWQGVHEQVLIENGARPDILYEHRPLRWRGVKGHDAQKIISIERESISKGPSGY